MKFNNYCYKLFSQNFEKGFLDDSVDITYIITMDNSKNRHDNIKKQLNIIAPTKKVIIVYNSGFKKCEKNYFNKRINISVEDLTYTYMYIFNDSKNYNRILILEDDFTLIRENLKENDKNNINNFLLNNNPNIYYLGCIPYLINPLTLNNKNLNLFIDATTHAVVFNKNIRNKILNLYLKQKIKIFDIDLLTCFKIKNKYTYYKPIYVQSFEETENKKNWGYGIQSNSLSLLINKILVKNIFDPIVSRLNLNSENEEKFIYGWKKAYVYIKILNLMIYILILFVILVVIKKFFILLNI